MLISDSSYGPFRFVQQSTTSILLWRLLLIAICFIAFAATRNPAQAESIMGTIAFDFPAVATAHPSPQHEDRIQEAKTEQVALAIDCSVFLPGDSAKRVDHVIVRCIPRDTRWRVLDYSPKTETASEFASPIEHKQTDESTNSGGISADLAYAHLVNGHLGAERGDKQSETLTYQRHAPVHAHVTSGTIQRRSGVYFKLRRSTQHVLEGEHRFDLVFSVPLGMRGGLIDVQVLAMGSESSRLRWDSVHSITNKPRPDSHATLRENHFVIAVARADDSSAQQWASRLAATEQHLRERARQHSKQDRTASSLSTLYRHVAARLDWSADDRHGVERSSSIVDSGDWIDRLIHGDADPYTDRVIAKLPVDVRVEALRYCDLRRQLCEPLPHPIGSYAYHDEGSHADTQ